MLMNTCIFPNNLRRRRLSQAIKTFCVTIHVTNTWLLNTCHVYFCPVQKMDATATKVTQFVVTILVLVLFVLLLFDQRENIVLYDPRNLFNKSRKEPEVATRNEGTRMKVLHPIHQERSEHLWKMCKEENVPTSPEVPQHIQYVLNHQVIQSLKNDSPYELSFFRWRFVLYPKQG